MRYLLTLLFFVTSAQISFAHGTGHIHPHGLGELVTIIALGSALVIGIFSLAHARAKRKRNK